MTAGRGETQHGNEKAPRVAFRVQKGGAFSGLDTVGIKPSARESRAAGGVAVILTALGTLLTGPAAFLNALK